MVWSKIIINKDLRIIKKKVAKRVDLKSCHHKKKRFVRCIVMEFKQIYCGDHFATYTHVESLCCTNCNGIDLLYLKKK